MSDSCHGGVSREAVVGPVLTVQHDEVSSELSSCPSNTSRSVAWWRKLGRHQGEFMDVASLAFLGNTSHRNSPVPLALPAPPLFSSSPPWVLIWWWKYLDLDKAVTHIKTKQSKDIKMHSKVK